MSAIAVIPLDDCIIFAADGITFDPESGLAGGTVNKIALFPHLECIIGSVGAGGFLQAMAMAMYSKYPTFDALIDDAGQLAQFTYHEMEKQGVTGDNPVKVVFGGWSQSRERFEVYKMHSHATRSAGRYGLVEQLAWECYPIEDAWVSTTPDAEIMDRFGLNDDNPKPLDFSARLICAARATTGLLENPSKGVTEEFAVGGFLQMAILERNKVTSWIAHRWPDVEGQLVNPENGAPMPVFPIVVP